jgi:hypothetical protein
MAMLKKEFYFLFFNFLIFTFGNDWTIELTSSYMFLRLVELVSITMTTWGVTKGLVWDIDQYFGWHYPTKISLVNFQEVLHHPSIEYI